MKFLVSLLFLCAGLKASAQPAARIFTERTDSGFVLLADNPEWYPVTIVFTMENTNLVFSEGGRMQFVLPARSTRYRIGGLRQAKMNESYRLKYRYQSCMGDVKARPSDTTYLLPYAKGAEYLLYQGYNGSFSHGGENSIDWTMPEGTQVRAARGGLVVQVVESNDRHCATPDCKQYNNFICILHTDGTFAYYAHIRQGGSLVKPGSSVLAGDPIAWSGNVGYTNGPHLHFSVFTGGLEGWTSWPTKFATESGPARLREGQSYRNTY